MNLGKVIAHIPARAGSKRVPEKNLRYLAGQPMIAYAIKAALACKRLEEVYVNTDSESLAKLGAQLGSRVYRRDLRLASDHASGDDFTIDFIQAMGMDSLAMVSPVCPLLETADISAALVAYETSDADTLISCSQTGMQAFHAGTPINVNPSGPLVPTQKNTVVSICNWAVTIWNASKFCELYDRFKGGYFGENRIFWPLAPLKCVKVSEEEDFRLAESLLEARAHQVIPTSRTVRYWKEGDEF